MTQDDETLRRRLVAELDFDPSLDAAHITVAVHNGVVTLTGQVASLAQKEAARAAVTRVRGVRAIAQEIQVLPVRHPESDADLAERVASLLGWTDAVPRGAVTVEVTDGVVTLRGEVEWDYQRRVAEQVVRALADVVDVRNAVALKFRHPPADIQGRIEEALARHALAANDVRVTAKGGQVTLSGRVNSWFDGDLAERVAWSVPGVGGVCNNLTIANRGDDEA
jgi:osmotically-inducible protein OsmY